MLEPSWSQMTVIVIVQIVAVALALLLLGMSIRIMREYERVVVFRPGRLRGASDRGSF